MSVCRGWPAALLLLCLTGCTSLPQTDYGTTLSQRIPDRVELTEVPFHPQDEFQCGPAALATVLGSVGIVRSPQELKNDVYLPQRQGSLQPEMLAAARRAGLLAYRLEPQPSALLQEVAAGHPVVVLQNLSFQLLPQWHYAVAVGYDLSNRNIILRSGTEKRLVMHFADFDRSWAKSDRWAFVALAPDILPATAHEVDFVAAASLLERTAPSAARRAYQTALAVWPTNLTARIASGNVAYQLHQLDAAQAQYQQATIDHPDAADAWNNLAQVLYEMGKWQQAREAAQQAITIGGPRLRIYESTLTTIETRAKQ